MGDGGLDEVATGVGAAGVAEAGATSGVGAAGVARVDVAGGVFPNNEGFELAKR